MISLMFYCSIPIFYPAAFQRILIGRNLRQVKKAFIISAFLVVLVTLTTSWISIPVLNVRNNFDSSQLLGFVIDKYAFRMV